MLGRRHRAALGRAEQTLHRHRRGRGGCVYAGVGGRRERVAGWAQGRCARRARCCCRHWGGNERVEECAAADAAGGADEPDGVWARDASKGGAGCDGGGERQGYGVVGGGDGGGAAYAARAYERVFQSGAVSAGPVFGGGRVGCVDYAVGYDGVGVSAESERDGGRGAEFEL